MRTPRAEGAGGRDRILAEAQNLQKLTNAQTPLFGGENPELHASDFAGITPRNTVPTTPHPLAAAATPQARRLFAMPLQHVGDLEAVSHRNARSARCRAFQLRSL